jgi:hypothetical protein
VTRSAAPTLAARFDSADVAREAIKRLENSGVDGADIQLLTSGATARQPPADPQTEDRRIGRYVVPGVAFGAIVGGVVGAVLGLGLAAALSAVTDLAISGGVVAACVLAGILIVSAVGAFIGMERRIGFSESWTRTFDDYDNGPLWVAVRAPDESVFERARNALQTVGPLELRSDGTAPHRNSN